MFVNESQLARVSSLFLAMPTLESSRLILRPFREDDTDRMAELFAHPDFMRFSLGVYTKREQTVVFIEKVMGWDREGRPSQFALVPRDEEKLIGLLRVLSSPRTRNSGHRDWLSPRSRLLESRSGDRSGPRRARSRFSRFETRARDFAGSSGKHSIPACGREKRNDR
jgi:hypothetical protein